MFKINGLEINVTGEQLLNDLKFSLNQNGIYLLNTIKVGNNNIQFSCPAHKEGQERTPSCGMSTVPTYKGNKEYPAGTVHCFTCGYTATLEEFISYCFGYQDGGILGNRWLKANYRTSMLQKSRNFKLEFNTEQIKQELPTIPDEELNELLDEYASTTNDNEYYYSDIDEWNSYARKYTKKEYDEAYENLCKEIANHVGDGKVDFIFGSSRRNLF